MNLNPLQFGKREYVSPYEHARRDRRREKIATGAVGVALTAALAMGTYGAVKGGFDDGSHVQPGPGHSVTYVPGDK
jgi:hypothetical protein